MVINEIRGQYKAQNLSKVEADFRSALGHFHTHFRVCTYMKLGHKCNTYNSSFEFMLRLDIYYHIFLWLVVHTSFTSSQVNEMCKGLRVHSHQRG